MRKTPTETVREFLSTVPRYSGIEANEQMMLKAAEADPDSPVDIQKVFSRIKNRLGTNADYEDAYRVFWAQHPEFKLECNQNILDDALGRDKISAEALENLLHPGNPNFCGDRLALTGAAVQDIADAAERARLVEQISIGKVTYWTRRIEDGKAVEWQTAGLAEESLENLRAIAAFVEEQRRVLGMSREDARTERPAFTPEKGKALYASRFLKIPSKYSPPDKEDVLIPWSTILIKKLPAVEISRLLRIYGTAQIDAACAAKEK